MENNYIFKPTALVNGITFVHKDYKVDESTLNEPLNKGFIIKTDDKESFLSLVKEYAGENSKLFYSSKFIEAKLDFHTKEKQNFNNREIRLELIPHSYYSHFLEIVAKPMSQRGFVSFLKSFYVFLEEQNGVGGLELISIAESLNAATKIDSVQKNTSQSLSLETEIKSKKGSVEIPTKLKFSLPMFEATPNDKITLEFELFLELKDNSFEVRLLCYEKPIKERDALESLVDSIKSELNLKSYKIINHS